MPHSEGRVCNTIRTILELRKSMAIMLKLLPCLRGYNSSKKMIHFAHESEAAIDTFIMNIMQQNSESNSELHD